MMKFLQELARGSSQADMKTSDGSNAGAKDMTSKPVDVGFSLMRNMINTDSGVTGSDVNDYLERAQDLNDEVETAGFAVETDEGDIIKIYVNAQEADSFEEELSKLLGLEGDSEEAINQLAQKFDIVDVVWPRDPEGNSTDPNANLSIDGEEPDDGSVLDTDNPPEVPTDADGNVLTGDVEADDVIAAAAGDDDEDAPKKHKAKKSDPSASMDGEGGDDEFEDIPEAPGGESDAGEPGDDEPAGEEGAGKDEGGGGDDVTGGAEGGEDVTPDENAEEEAEEPVLDADGNQKLDDEGNPVMKKKAKKKAPKAADTESSPDEGAEIKTEEGLERKGSLLRELRASDDITSHITDVQARGNRGKYFIEKTVSGGIQGRHTTKLQQGGTVAYFGSLPEATAEAERLTKIRNRAGATASYKYVPKLVEETQMTLGSKFLSRLGADTITEAPLKTSDPFINDVLKLCKALGVPDANLGYKVNELRESLMAVRASMEDRAMVDQKLKALMMIIGQKKKTVAAPAASTPPKNTPDTGTNEGLILEAFGELEALTHSDLQHFNMEEPANGPAMLAAYEGGSQHAETVLAMGIDPEADGQKTLRVGIDGPWDGSIHAKYFTDDKDGYKEALTYANMLRTANLKSGGRPKGWK